MSKETWLMMVAVAKQKLDARTPTRRRKVKRSLQLRSVREDHYVLLLAAEY